MHCSSVTLRARVVQNDLENIAGRTMTPGSSTAPWVLACVRALVIPFYSCTTTQYLLSPSRYRFLRSDRTTNGSITAIPREPRVRVPIIYAPVRRRSPRARRLRYTVHIPGVHRFIRTYVFAYFRGVTEYDRCFYHCRIKQYTSRMHTHDPKCYYFTHWDYAACTVNTNCWNNL